MKNLRVLGVVLAFGVLIGMAACAQKTGTSTQVSQSVGGDTQVSATAAVDGEALILEKLQNHHSIDRVYSAQKTREEWNATLDRMISYGAKISEAEKQIIIDYLLSR
ncbi:hypothetical protein EG832_12670 [bacterium]|nr:hypothetical protein [bacterium]